MHSHAQGETCSWQCGQAFEAVKKAVLEKACMHMYTAHWHTLNVALGCWVLGLGLALRMQNDDDKLWCGVCGYATRPGYGDDDKLYSEGQWMEWHIFTYHGNDAFFGVVNHKGNTPPVPRPF